MPFRIRYVMVFLSHLHDTGGAEFHGAKSAPSPRPPAKAGLPGDFYDRQISLEGDFWQLLLHHSTKWQKITGGSRHNQWKHFTVHVVTRFAWNPCEQDSLPSLYLAIDTDHPNYLRKLSNHPKILATVNSTLKVAPQKMKRIATWSIQFDSSSGPSSQSLDIDPPTTPDVALVALKALTAA